MQKGFGLIRILIVIGIIAGIGALVFKSVSLDKNPFMSSAEEKSAIDMAEQVKDVVEIEKKMSTAVSRIVRTTPPFCVNAGQKKLSNTIPV